MNIADRIYGKVEVKDSLIAELIQSAPMKRLKKISQDGATHFIQPIFDGNRFEHCFGAWYLASRFDRPRKEQVACLLHDVPHTAFSHVVDFALEDHNQEFHERFLRKIVMHSEIPKICEKYGMDIEEVLEEELYPLLHNNTPELSFDRWDYFMRDAFMIGLLSHEMIEKIITSAKLLGEHFYFEDLRVASQLSITSLSVSQLAYVSATSHGAWSLLAQAIKIAMKQGIISEEDLFATDDEVWRKLKNSKNSEIDSYLRRLQPGNEFEYASKGDAEFYSRNKARYIDPFVLKNGVLVPVSEQVVGLKGYMQSFRNSCQYIGVK